MELKEPKPLRIQQNKLLSDLTTIGIGGPAQQYLDVKNIAEMREVFAYCKNEKIPFFILGKGSNCVFDDAGFSGLVIGNRIDFVENLEPGVYKVGAGHSFSRFGSWTARHHWSGLEFASGIPASVGGAVYMNAGANGAETCDCLTSVEFLDADGMLHTYLKEELHFSYRHSSFQTMKGAIISATFKLTESDEAREKQLKIIEYRTATQPYGDKSAGCVFRNPAEGHAGALIDKLNLKGLQIGGAAVSDLHANFLINKSGASAADLRALVAHIQQIVKEKTAINLEPEVRFIPYRMDE